MRYEAWIAMRYLRRKGWGLFISRVGLLGMMMIGVSNMIPMVSLSLINGFHESVKSKHINKDYHIQVKKWDFYNYEKVKDRLRDQEDIQSKIGNIYGFYRGQGLVKYGYSDYHGVLIRGIEKDFYEGNLSLREHFPIIAGKYETEKKFNVVLGVGLVKSLMGDGEDYEGFMEDIEIGGGRVIDLLVLEEGLKMKVYRLKVSGVYQSGYLEYDQLFGFTTLETSQMIFGARKRFLGQEYGRVSGLGIELKDRREAGSVRLKIKEGNRRLKVYDWEMLNAHLLHAFEWEKILMGIILGIMIFGSIVVTVYIFLNMVVIQKKKEIGIMKSFGVKDKSIRNIFMLEGFLIGMMGTFFGNIMSLYILMILGELMLGIEEGINLGMGLVGFSGGWNFLSGGLEHLKRSLYSVEYVDFLGLSALSILISMIGAYFSARGVLKEGIVEVLRYD